MNPARGCGVSVLVSALILVSAFGARAQPFPVTVTDLGTLGGARTSARDINDLGQVVGWSETASGESHAFLWTKDGGMQDLGTLGGANSYAYGINNLGQVAGWSYTGPSDQRAFLWTAEGGMQDLGTLERDSRAYGINNRGQVVGQSSTSNGIRAFLWTAEGGTRDLGASLGDLTAVALGINDRGLVTGYHKVSPLPDDIRGFVWTPQGGTRDLREDKAEARSANNLGQVVGYYYLWTEEGGFQDLPFHAYDINDLGQVVGDGYLWTADGGVQDLGAPAIAINNRGQIAGGGLLLELDLGPDGDGDGVADAVDVCPEEAGAAPFGCRWHDSDYNPADWTVNLSELLRAIQFYNIGEYCCDPQGEDNYAPGFGDRSCIAHASDYNPQDWSINLSELLRAIQFYNSGGHHPDPTSEDGFSPYVGPSPMVWAMGSSRYLQYRVYEDPAANRYRAWIPTTRNGMPLPQSELFSEWFDARILDPTGNLLNLTGAAQDVAYMSYSCLTAPCTLSGPTRESGAMVWPSEPLTAGLYTIEVETIDAQTVTEQIDYAGPLALPVVPGATMSAEWLGPDLHLQWASPTADPAWMHVAQLNVVLYDATGAERLFATLHPSATEITLPAQALVAASGLAGDGTLASWRVQTWAYDTAGMNYARGVSHSVPLPSPVLPVYQIRGVPYVQYRTYEDAAENRFQSWLGLMKDGVPIAENEVVDVGLYELFGDRIPESSGAFHAGYFLFYNCTVWPPSLSEPIPDYGFSRIFGSVSAGDYLLSAETADGQFVAKLLSYPGRLEAPVVASSTMTASWIGEDLELGWASPAGAPNWSRVSRIYAVLADSGGKDILYVYVNPGEETVTVPASVLQSALQLGDGTWASWGVQTRINDTTGMNYARGYSNPVPLPAGP